MREVTIIYDYAGYIREDFYPACGIDIPTIRRAFENKNFSVNEYSYDDLINGNVQIKNNYIVYSSSQKPEYKAYIDDCLYQLSKNNVLLPRYDIFRAHENKGFQELLKKELGIRSLSCVYLATLKDIYKHRDKITYPVVIKKVNGAMSSYVSKADTEQDLIKQIKSMNSPVNKLLYFLDKYLDQHILKKKYIHYDRECDYFGRYVLQEFVHGLQEDWKVVICYDKYYLFRRKVRHNDFRASGSGKFDFLVQPPEGLLDFAEQVFNMLDVPFLSVDICFSNNQFYLIEYQGTHFGPIAVINSEGYYTRTDQGSWTKIKTKSVFAEVYADSLIRYVEKMENNA
ncbi:ATP-grasp domain-containing protein [Paenibacillus alkalitolerans]|uniref:hypothetical protein n=1 Tax=Paenibacillus alkalitolerans TaxID=2799335 RepID=UPI0018F2E8DD|nr:hypothetical protein [Paenibacillus alkalitolerans]